MRPHLVSSRSLALFGLVTVLLGIAATATAQELIPPKVTTRRYPQGTWCPLPFDIEFTPISTTVTIKFDTNNFYFNENDNFFHWTEQYLDNICVSPKVTYDANVQPYTNDCYFPHPDEQLASVYYFEDAGTLPFKEVFADDPTARGWDLEHGAYWKDSTGGPVGAGDEGTRPVGMLGLGSYNDGIAALPYTTVNVSGLTAGQPYVLTGWWFVNDLLPDKVNFTVTILTDAATPVAKKSWGQVKTLYRGDNKSN